MPAGHADGRSHVSLGLHCPRVAVCGFGRCGSSMLMRMLAAGGLPTAPGASPGSGEHASVEDALRAATPGTAVKLLDLKLATENGINVDLSGEWSIVWLDRDPRWQAESFRKFARALLGLRLTVAETRRWREGLERDRDPSVGWLADWGHPLLAMRYEAVLTDPHGQASLLAEHLGWAGLDVDAMARVVHVRSPRTLPDLAVELASADDGEPAPPR